MDSLMLDLTCDMCHRNLDEPGGLIFSPPVDEAWIVEKYHVCAFCWPEIVALLKRKKGNPSTNQDATDV